MSFHATAYQYLFIGTGNVNGVYYPIGNALCRVLEQADTPQRFHCAAESSGGSRDNIYALRQGDIELALVQSDVHWQAYQGLGDYAPQGPFHQLRTLMHLHPEVLTLLVRADSGLTQLSDLRYKKINIGSKGSGQHASMMGLLKQLNWPLDELNLSELRSDEQSRALCAGKVDAISFVVGHPNLAVEQAASLCEARILNLDPLSLSQLSDNAYFSPAHIAAGTYSNNPHITHSLGLRAALVSTDSLPEQTAYEVVEAIFHALPRLRQLHPVLSDLQAQDMVTMPLSAPLHAGAQRYYLEHGWLKAIH